MDFMADTGDGGNPTYAVARSLAAPQLPVNTPAHLSDLAERLSARPAPDGAGSSFPSSNIRKTVINNQQADAPRADCQED